MNRSKPGFVVQSRFNSTIQTELLEGEEVSAATERLQKRGVDYVLMNNPEDPAPIEQVLEQEILNDPSKPIERLYAT